MLTPATTDQTLRAENAELRARLEEAEQMLRAIRAGEVDALVVEGDAGPQLFTLQGVDAEQNRLRGEMLAQVSDAVVAVDTGDCIMYLNAVGERLYGVRSADVLGCKRPEVYTRCWSSPEDEARMDAALSARGEWRGELVHRARDGREFPVEVSLTVLRGADGEYKGRIATIRDVTSRKKIEQEKAEALRLLDTLLTRAPVGFVFLDRDLRFVRINERFAEMNGLSVAAHLGRSVAEIIPALEATVREVTARVLATGQPVLDHEFIGETAHAPGITRHWNESWYPVRDERGEIIGFGAVVEDVTERRKSEAVLRLTNERFDLAVKASKVVLFQQDLELRYQWIENPAPGFDGAEVFGKRDADLMERAEDAAVTEALKREVIRSGVGVQQEVVVYIQNAARHFHLLVEPVRDAAGLISGVTCAAIDITERKRAEEARQESETHLRYALQAATAGAWNWNIRTGGIAWSPENYVLYDIDPAQGPPRYEDWESRLHPEDRDRVNEHRRAVLDGREAEFRTEFRVVNRQGAVRWLQGLGRVDRDRDGQAVRLSGLNLDITARKLAEAQRRETERNYRALASASSEIAYRMSADWSTMLPLDGRELFVSSDRPLADWGWMDQYLPRDEQARVRQTVSDAIAGKNLFEMEHRFLRPDGSIGWVRSRAVPIHDENEKVIAWFGAASDITARKQAEERLRLAIAGSDLGTWHWDLRTGALDWSERCLKIFGLPPRTAMSYEKFLGALHPEERARADDAVQRALQDGSEYRIEFRSVWPDGSVHWAVSLGRAYYNDAGEPTRMEGIALDITESKRAEEARHEIERNYRALAAASSEVAYRMSADWSMMLPLDGRQLVASSDQPLADWAWLDQNLPRDEHPRVRQAISEAIARKTLFELEHRVRYPDGSIGWTFSRAVPILDENEKVIAWFGAASDITERKQAEERLRASEARLRRVFESNVVGMVRWDLDRSLILDANAEFLRMTGYVRDDIVSGRLNFRDLTPPEWAARNEESIHAIRADGQAPPYEKEYFHKDGSRLPLLIAGTRFEDSPSEGMSFLVDLTEMKQAEAVLRDRTELLNGVLEGTTDVIFAKDRNGRLLLANAAFAAAARSTPEQLVGKTDEAWFPPDVAAAVRQQDEAVIAGGSPMQFEDTVPVAGEARSFLTLKAPLRDGSNRVVGILGIGRDITERKLLELNLIHATAVAEKANRAKSDFLSNMSHELRTPLNAILGFAQLLESGAPALAPGQMRNVEQILKGGWYLLELINEILDFAVIESGKLSLTLEPVSLAEVMLECQDMSEPQARRRGIDMTFPSFDVQGYVRADRTRLKQIVINLLSNAIKYNKAQGAVAVEWTLRPPDSIRLSVRDTGEGLSQQQLAQLFQPFNRLGREAGAEEGTGIGLVLTKRLTEMMGGAVGAESVVGVGSVFWFELKLASAPQAALHEAEGSAQPPPRVPAGTPLRNVVYVEDNPANLALMEQLIARRPDLRLLSATDGNRGIELTRAHQPQVILLDVNLPGISGIEVMKILRADPSTAHIPIVALSANALPRDIEDGIKAGFFNYLTKPLKVTQFMEALDLALDYSQFAPGRAIGKEPD